jgi:hypothetical protein
MPARAQRVQPATVGVESGCVTDGRTVGAAGSFENAGKVKSKRYSG